MTSRHRSSSEESVLFLAWKTNDSKYSRANAKTISLNIDNIYHIFGLKYLSNDGINQDHFHCENFEINIYL